MSSFVSPVLLYVACALGAVGVALALPKKKVAPFVFGAIIGAAGLAVGLVALGIAAKRMGPGHLPNFFFYVFSVVALGSALRVITHQRPIYAALWFILTIVASCGLYAVLAAEFMAFALVIVYGGAILITYLFVIMLASEGATEEATEGMAEYDRSSREPLIATFAGFLVLAVLTTMLGLGSSSLTPNAAARATDQPLSMMPERVERELRGAGLLSEGEQLNLAPDPTGRPGFVVDMAAPDSDRALEGKGWVVIDNNGRRRVIDSSRWPESLRLSNVERVSFELIDRNPGAIEIAGVILLMAMLGAIVMARKKVEMDEAARLEAAERVREQGDFGREAAFIPPAVGGNT